MNDAASPITLTAYAARRGVSKMAVSRAVKGGRLRASVARDERGRPMISDPDLADREWEASTDLSKAPGYVKERESARAAQTPDLAPAPPAPDPTQSSGDAGAPANLSLGEESAREKFWKANLAELDFRKRSGELVEAREMTDRIADVFTRVRARLLALPTRTRQQLPHLTVADVGAVDVMVREALEELVLDFGREEGPEARHV